MQWFVVISVRLSFPVCPIASVAVIYCGGSAVASGVVSKLGGSNVILVGPSARGKR